MSQLIEFVTKEDQAIEKNLSSFISLNENNIPFKDVNWKDNIWDITSFLSNVLINAKLKKVYFRSIEDNSIQKSKLEIAFPYPLLDFTKSAFCEIMRLKKLSEYKRIIYAVQAIEAGLKEQKRTICVTQIDSNTLTLSENYLRQKYKDPWNIARQLEYLINKIIIKNRLNKHLYEWNTTILYQAPARSDRVNHQNSEGNESKIPHLEELLALADIHVCSTHIPDRIVTSFVVLALFAPNRASEILSLPIDCIAKQEVNSKENASSQDDNNEEIMGLRWRPVKGGDPLVKFAVTQEFAELATNVIDYLLTLGEPARKAAKWYSENPTKLYLPEHLLHLRDQPITLWEVCQILGKENPIKACHAFRYGFSKPISKTTDKNRMAVKTSNWVSLYDFKELENYVISLLPKTFPILDGRTQQHWHESLFILPMHILKPDADTLKYIPFPIHIDQINNQLGSNPSKITIFSRNQKKFESGKNMEITTHQFRHLLNTLAQSKALSQELIAFWSGRKSIKQNDYYNHLSQEAYIDAYRLLVNQVSTINQVGNLENKATVISKTNAISYDEALKIELGSIHITRYGICRHDYSLTPCPKDKDCGNCGEFSVMKGSEHHKKEVNAQVNLLEKAILDAEKAESGGHPGARRWLDLNKSKLERWRKILDFLENEKVPDGSMYTIQDDVEFHQTKVGLAFELREQTPKIENSSEERILDLLKN